MNILESFYNISYNDPLQLDSALSMSHSLHNKNTNSHLAENTILEKFDTDNYDLFYKFNGTIELDNSDIDTRLFYWKKFWIEYITTFDQLVHTSPDSIVTIFTGRQAIEIGLKYLLLKKINTFELTHDLKKLSDSLFSIYKIKENYMKDVDKFCNLYTNYIEGVNTEYFRFPEYRKDRRFSGDFYDLDWLAYNISLVLLKLIHYANLECEFSQENHKQRENCVEIPNGENFFKELKKQIEIFSNQNCWKDIYRNSSEWTNYMTKGRDSQNPSFIDKTLEKLYPNANLYHEYYRIDNTACETIESFHKDQNNIKIHQWKLLAAVEHENDYTDWTDELVKLLNINCPLRIVIGYDDYQNNYQNALSTANLISKNLKFEKYINNEQEFILIFGPRTKNLNTKREINLSKYFVAYKWDNLHKEFVNL